MIWSLILLPHQRTCVKWQNNKRPPINTTSHQHLSIASHVRQVSDYSSDCDAGFFLNYFFLFYFGVCRYFTPSQIQPLKLLTSPLNGQDIWVLHQVGFFPFVLWKSCSICLNKTVCFVLVFVFALILIIAIPNASWNNHQKCRFICVKI